MQGMFDIGLVSSQIFWFLLGFSVLCGFFYFSVFPRLGKLYSKRKKHISSYTDDAKQLKQEAENLQIAYEKHSEDILKEIRELKNLKILDDNHSINKMKANFTNKISKRRVSYNEDISELESIVIQELEDKASVYASMILTKLNDKEGK